MNMYVFILKYSDFVYSWDAEMSMGRDGVKFAKNRRFVPSNFFFFFYKICEKYSIIMVISVNITVFMCYYYPSILGFNLNIQQRALLNDNY